MAPVSPGRGGGGGGDGTTPLGPAQNTFGTPTTASRAAAIALRNTYATANPAWLALYNANRAFLIRLVWTGNAQAFQRRNAAGNDWEDVTRVVPGTQGEPGPPGPVQTAEQIADALDAYIGDAEWRSRLSGTALVAAIDNAVGSNVWRTGHTVLRTAQQVINLLDGSLGTAWRTGGSGGTGGITLEQATDAAGALLATLAQFTYNADTNTLAFALEPNSVTSAQAQADSAAHKRDWRNRINIGAEFAALAGATFTGATSGVRPTQPANFTTKEYVDEAIAAIGGGSSSHSLYLWGAAPGVGGAQPTITALDAGAATSDTLSIVVPSFDSGDFLVLVQPQAADDISYIEIEGQNQTGSFAKAGTTFTDSGTTYEYWISNRPQGVSIVGDTLTIRR